MTAALHVDYMKPTPLGGELEIRARVEEFTAAEGPHPGVGGRWW